MQVANQPLLKNYASIAAGHFLPAEKPQSSLTSGTANHQSGKALSVNPCFCDTTSA
jgi:hypothetical protein